MNKRTGITGALSSAVLLIGALLARGGFKGGGGTIHAPVIPTASVPVAPTDESFVESERYVTPGGNYQVIIGNIGDDIGVGIIDPKTEGFKGWILGSNKGPDGKATELQVNFPGADIVINQDQDHILVMLEKEAVPLDMFGPVIFSIEAAKKVTFIPSAPGRDDRGMVIVVWDIKEMQVGSAQLNPAEALRGGGINFGYVPDIGYAAVIGSGGNVAIVSADQPFSFKVGNQDFGDSKDMREVVRRVQEAIGRGQMPGPTRTPAATMTQ